MDYITCVGIILVVIIVGIAIVSVLNYRINEKLIIKTKKSGFFIRAIYLFCGFFILLALSNIFIFFRAYFYMNSYGYNHLWTSILQISMATFYYVLFYRNQYDFICENKIIVDGKSYAIEEIESFFFSDFVKEQKKEYFRLEICLRDKNIVMKDQVVANVRNTISMNIYKEHKRKVEDFLINIG